MLSSPQRAEAAFAGTKSLRATLQMAVWVVYAVSFTLLLLGYTTRTVPWFDILAFCCSLCFAVSTVAAIVLCPFRRFRVVGSRNALLAGALARVLCTQAALVFAWGKFGFWGCALGSLVLGSGIIPVGIFAGILAKNWGVAGLLALLSGGTLALTFLGTWAAVDVRNRAT